MKPAAAKVGGNQGRMAGRRLAVGFLQIVPGEFPAGVVTPMKPAAAKDGGNQGRMAGRRRAVGFLQIVPGEAPGCTLTDYQPAGNRSPIENGCTPCLSGAVGRDVPSQCGALQAQF